MYQNIENHPLEDVKTTTPRLNTDKHISLIRCISKMLSLIAQTRERIAYSQKQYDTHSFLSSPFVTKERWLEDVKKWSYINWRLERYYMKKVCELNKISYQELMQ